MARNIHWDTKWSTFVSQWKGRSLPNASHYGVVQTSRTQEDAIRNLALYVYRKTAGEKQGEDGLRKVVEELEKRVSGLEETLRRIERGLGEGGGTEEGEEGGTEEGEEAMGGQQNGQGGEEDKREGRAEVRTGQEGEEEEGGSRCEELQLLLMTIHQDLPGTVSRVVLMGALLDACMKECALKRQGRTEFFTYHNNNKYHSAEKAVYLLTKGLGYDYVAVRGDGACGSHALQFMKRWKEDELPLTFWEEIRKVKDRPYLEVSEVMRVMETYKSFAGCISVVSRYGLTTAERDVQMFCTFGEKRASTSEEVRQILNAHAEHSVILVCAFVRNALDTTSDDLGRSVFLPGHYALLVKGEGERYPRSTMYGHWDGKSNPFLSSAALQADETTCIMCGPSNRICRKKECQMIRRGGRVSMDEEEGYIVWDPN